MHMSQVAHVFPGQGMQLKLLHVRVLSCAAQCLLLLCSHPTAHVAEQLRCCHARPAG